MAQGKAFKGRQFTAEVILWAVRWYLMFPISYRDLELMLQDRGVAVDEFVARIGRLASGDGWRRRAPLSPCPARGCRTCPSSSTRTAVTTSRDSGAGSRTDTVGEFVG